MAFALSSHAVNDCSQTAGGEAEVPLQGSRVTQPLGHNQQRLNSAKTPKGSRRLSQSNKITIEAKEREFTIDLALASIAPYETRIQH